MMITAQEAIELGLEHNRERTFLTRHKEFMEKLDFLVKSTAKNKSYLKVSVLEEEMDKKDFQYLMKLLRSDPYNYTIRTFDPDCGEIGFEMWWGLK